MLGVLKISSWCVRRMRDGDREGQSIMRQDKRKEEPCVEEEQIIKKFTKYSDWLQYRGEVYKLSESLRTVLL